MIVHNPSYLLLLSCGKTKRREAGVMPAIQRYNGPIWHDLRSLIRQGYRLPKILILSAQYGLIEPETLIENYDLEITQEIGDAMARSCEYRALFRTHLAEADAVLSVAGSLYDRVFRQWLMANETYAREWRGIGWKRRTMAQFVRGIPKEGRAA